MILKNNRITVLGGTGSLGQALIPELLIKFPNVELTIVSRDEHKQALMKRKFPALRYQIADIRDRSSIHSHISGRDVVFHVAALKHVDILESNPVESIKTNILATEILASLAVASGVSHFIFSSTDKAVDPINTYGYCKAVSEKILFDYNTKQNVTKFGVYRWGNVLGSQGSAIPFFAHTLKTEGRAYLTHRDMTRFWIPLEHAIRYMLRSFDFAKPDLAMVPPNMKAARVEDVIKCVAYLLAIPFPEIIETGRRPGEKIHEAMYSMHSADYLTSQTSEQYSFDELVDLLLPVVGENIKKGVA